MSNPCKGICETLECDKLPRMGSRYAVGYKRCTECEVFLKIPDVRCPCCQTILRTRPRSGRKLGKII